MPPSLVLQFHRSVQLLVGDRGPGVRLAAFGSGRRESAAPRESGTVSCPFTTLLIWPIPPRLCCVCFVRTVALFGLQMRMTRMRLRDGFRLVPPFDLPPVERIPCASPLPGTLANPPYRYP